MDDSDRDLLRAYLRGDGGEGEDADPPATRADLLIAGWRSIPAETKAPGLDCSYRAWMLASWMNWATLHPWAWEALRALYGHLRAAREPVPALLQEWIDRCVVFGDGPPGSGMGRPVTMADRDMRIVAAVRSLVESGYSRPDAWLLCSEALNVEPQTIRSAVRKYDRVLAASH